MMVSEFQSQRITGNNNAPEFADVQDPVTGQTLPIMEIAKREVAENTDAGKTVGSPVVATDDDDDTLTYTLTDAGRWHGRPLGLFWHRLGNGPDSDQGQAGR